MPDVLVAVVSWNTRALLDACLTSLEPEVRKGLASVVVVDNGSTDGSAELARERHPWAQVVAGEANLGFGPAVNLAVERGPRTAWVAPANADVALEPGALAALLAAGGADARAGAVAPRLVLPGGATQHSVHRFPTLALAAAFNLGLPSASRALADRLLIEGAWDPERARVVPWALGAFLLVRRSAWDELGGFDPAQWMYAEDVDLCWRLGQAGWHVRYEPSARVRHASGAATSQAFGEGMTDRWQAETYAWMRRRWGPVRTRAVAAVNLAGSLARWLPRVPLARLRPERFAHRRDQWRAWVRRHGAGLKG